MNMDSRALLERTPNPSPAIDYLNKLEGSATSFQSRVTVHYVPDKNIVAPTDFARYLAGFDDAEHLSLEEFAAAILDDFNNEIVPRWVQIRAARQGDGTIAHHVLIEDRQPKWDNQALLARMKGF